MQRVEVTGHGGKVNHVRFFGLPSTIGLMVIALDRAPTGIALTLMTTTPIWLLPLGWAFQGDRPSLREAVGACVAIGGVALLLVRA